MLHKRLGIPEISVRNTSCIKQCSYISNLPVSHSEQVIRQKIGTIIIVRYHCIAFPVFIIKIKIHQRRLRFLFHFMKIIRRELSNNDHTVHFAFFDQFWQLQLPLHSRRHYLQHRKAFFLYCFCRNFLIHLPVKRIIFVQIMFCNDNTNIITLVFLCKALG